MSMPSGESLESDDEARHGMAVILAIGQSVDGLGDMAVPLAGSVLAEEDRLNPYEPGSHLARHYDAVARDNLTTVAETCHAAQSGDPRGLPTFALYSQLRASIEAAGWAYWLLMNSAKATRLHRSLCITYGHAADFEDTMRAIGETWPADARIERLNQIRSDMPVTLRELGHPPGTSDMLRVVGSTFRQGEALTALNAWKLCSGIAHGSRPVVYNLSERRPVSRPDANGSVSLELFARVIWMAAIAQVSYDLLIAMRERFRDLATTDYARRSLG